MTRRTKVNCTIVFLAIGILAGAPSFAVCWLRSCKEGGRLAEEAYAAAFRGDFDTAMTRYSAHVQKSLGGFDGAIAVQPMNPMGYMERSNVYARKGEHDKQERDYQEALRLNPNIQNASRDFAESLAKRQWRAWSHNFATRNAGKDYYQLFRE